jgi:hypothetical protein
MLWGFNFDRVLDESGGYIPIDRDAVTDGFIVRPVPFE